MFKASSKHMQKPCRDKKKKESSIFELSPADEANERRSKFFWDVKECVGRGAALPDFLPPWVVMEINQAGGSETWIKRNYYWQKKIRDRQKENDE